MNSKIIISLNKNIMDRIRLQNFRSLQDTGEINIKPLTLLVGKNSSGKSSFLRFFPLIKQSLEESKHGPILWYKEKGVDFGDFETTVTKGENTIVMSFQIDILRYHFPEPKNKPALNVELSIKKENNSNYDYLHSASINYGDVDINMFFNQGTELKTDIIINGEVMPSARTYRRDNSLFPYIRTDEVEIDGFDYLTESMRKGTRYIYKTIDDFLFITFEEFNKKINGEEYPHNKIVIFNKIVYANLFELLRYVEFNLRFEVDSLVYIGPFRDAPQRYYRMQNLSANSIDMNGSNIAVYVKELGAKLETLNDILLTRFGFTIDVESNFGQISLFIIKDGNRTNIIDNGFGYSQILPIILATFQLKDNVNKYKMSTFSNSLCIEQPELHLHPKMQFEYGCMIADTLKTMEDCSSSRIKQKIILETHSRSIIEAIGQNIADKLIDRDDVAVYLFEEHPDKSSVSCVRSAEFNKEGYLNNWPLGFLD